MRIKIEINIQENFSILNRLSKEFNIQSDWFAGKAQINTFQFEELIATKLRALYQRNKGRDVFDLWLALKQDQLDIQKVVTVFEQYMEKENNFVSRDQFEDNLSLKLRENSFLGDMGPLLSNDAQLNRLSIQSWSLVDAAEEIKVKILSHLPKKAHH